MPSERARAALLDIRDNIDLAFGWTERLSTAAFANDRALVYAVTRCLEIISEASRRLPTEIHRRHPNIPWREVADAGNVYRHGYDRVQERILLETVRTSLPELRTAVVAELAEPGTAP